MIQFSRFDTGGFVLHKVVVNSSRYSAWFDSSGLLVAAERFVSVGRTATVSERSTKLRLELQRIGNRYRS